MRTPRESRATPPQLLVGTSGWGIASRYLAQLPLGGSHLQRYSRRFSAVEITTSFYRHHRRETYASWARSVGAAFRFSVKLPQALTHEEVLVARKSAVLDRFLSETEGLGRKFRVLLVQLPPSLEFDVGTTSPFFATLRRAVGAAVAIVCEPRHPTWSTAQADEFLKVLGVTRAAVDPSRFAGDAAPGGDPRLAYFRMHGSPRTYFSDYDADRLRDLKMQLQESADGGKETWCIFDNTAHGHAIGNAMSVERMMSDSFQAQRSAAPAAHAL